MAEPDSRRLSVQTRLQPIFDPSVWSGTSDSQESQHLRSESDRCLAAYVAKPSLVREHANIERATAQGGYGHRQVFELVQNGADALAGSTGRVAVVLTDEALYCANEGAPVDKWGVEAILSSHVSMKRGTEIGRFGLGFKSVLGVSTSPQFFSHSACFGFDAGLAADRIRTVVPDAERTPALRLANLLDPLAAAREDRVLAELMTWATTVVRLPRNAGDSTWLSADLASFPAEFLLFSPHVSELELDDRTTGESRVLTVMVDGTAYRLADGPERTEWRVFSVVHRPSTQARADAGELSDRDELPLIWAVPTRGRRRRGAFWAFFPTTYETTLSGILNAPWKTNEDRQNLLEGPFNEELLDAAAALVIDRLADLVDPEDPGHLLDYLPGRGDEARQWADRRLSGAVYALAAECPCLPDQEGNLRRPAEMRLHPASASEGALEMWSTSPDRPVNWCHRSVWNRDRRSRAERLLASIPASVEKSMARWIEALVAQSPTVEASATALRLLAAVAAEANLGERELLRRSPVVMTEGGALRPPSYARLCLRGAWQVAGDEMDFVHPALAAQPALVESLASLGVVAADATREFEALANSNRAVDWDHFWMLSRHINTSIAAGIVGRRPPGTPQVQVKNLSGLFVPLNEVLLPGRVVPEDGSRDAGVTVDVRYHADNLELLKALGLADGPTPTGGSPNERWFVRYRRYADERYGAALEGRRSRPQWNYLDLDRKHFSGPLMPIFKLGKQGRAAFTRVLFDEPSAFQAWHMAHATRRDSYPIVALESPVAWLLRSEGRLETSLGIVPFADAIGRGLESLKQVLPYAVLSHGLTAALGLPVSFSELNSGQLKSAFDRLCEAPEVATDEMLGLLYTAGAQKQVARGSAVVARVGSDIRLVELQEVTVCTTAAQLSVLRDLAVPAVLVEPADEEAVCEHFGFRPAEDVIETSIDAVAIAPDVDLVAEFPFLRDVVPNAESYVLVRCSSVSRLVVMGSDTRAGQEEAVLDGTRLYVVDGLGDTEVLEHLFGELGVRGADATDLVDRQRERARAQRLSRITDAPTPSERLLRAVGVASLQRHLSTGVIDGVKALRGDLDELALANLFLVSHGVDALRVLRHDLAQAGFTPPTTWAGSGQALAFVRDLGFSREFAGFEQGRRSPFLEVEGPISLNPLHPFQRHIADRVRSLLVSGDERRGLLSLPTGAGKTRVAVQSLIEAIADGVVNGPVLWVAQTDELCEQAVQTWSDVWRALGPQRPLHISRLWSSNEAEAVDMDHVVVATVAKLLHVIERPRYAWLADPSVVVIDEAHVSTAPSYTAVLHWLGLGRGRQARPLIGLTATPFRGRSEASAEELAARYGRRRLDAGAFDGDVYAALQEMGVLARVRHRVLGGTDIELDETELALLKQTGRLPSSVEERLGVNRDRNAAILESIGNLDDDWTVLVFAASVGHAQTLAAALSLEGVPAAAISAETPSAVRRHYVSEFKGGRLRVLTNYGVLTEGFDAPAVRAVYVGRPTFSPNLYQQMVGRGLRGPENGGKYECLIVDVADNFSEYGGDLAFRGFEHLWTEA